jgi:hypothetical protein
MPLRQTASGAYDADVNRPKSAVAIAGCFVAACVVETEPLPAAPVRPAAPAVAPAQASPVQSGGASIGGTSSAAPPSDGQRTCETDADCLAVPRNGCCHDGLNEPINKASADAYKASFTCAVDHPVCAMHLVLDRRVPACDPGTHMCKLIDPP